MSAKSTRKAAAPAMTDVSKPGTLMPGSSARPVVPNRSVVRDPMTLPEEVGIVEVEETSAPTHHASVRIEPLHETDEVAAEKVAVKREDDTSHVSKQLEEEVPKEQQDQESQEDSPNETEQAVAKTAAAREAEKAAAYAAEVDALIESKKYALPISPSKAQRRGLGIGITLLVLLVAAGGAYYYFFVM